MALAPPLPLPQELLHTLYALGFRTPEQVQQIVTFSEHSRADLQEKGVPSRAIDAMELYRPQLQAVLAQQRADRDRRHAMQQHRALQVAAGPPPMSPQWSPPSHNGMPGTPVSEGSPAISRTPHLPGPHSRIPSIPRDQAVGMSRVREGHGPGTQQQQQRQHPLFTRLPHTCTWEEQQASHALVRNLQRQLQVQSRGLLREFFVSADVWQEYVQALEYAILLADEVEGHLLLYAIFMHANVVRQLVLWGWMVRLQRDWLAGLQAGPPKYIIDFDSVQLIIKRVTKTLEFLADAISPPEAVQPMPFAPNLMAPHMMQSPGAHHPQAFPPPFVPPPLSPHSYAPDVPPPSQWIHPALNQTPDIPVQPFFPSIQSPISASNPPYSYSHSLTALRPVEADVASLDTALRQSLPQSDIPVLAIAPSPPSSVPTLVGSFSAALSTLPSGGSNRPAGCGRKRPREDGAVGPAGPALKKMKTVASETVVETDTGAAVEGLSEQMIAPAAQTKSPLDETAVSGIPGTFEDAETQGLHAYTPGDDTGQSSSSGPLAFVDDLLDEEMLKYLDFGNCLDTGSDPAPSGFADASLTGPESEGGLDPSQLALLSGWNSNLFADDTFDGSQWGGMAQPVSIPVPF